MSDSQGLTRWEIRKVKFTEVTPMEDNPRTITDKALSGLEASIERFGYVEPIVWNERTGHIIGGHQRFSVLKNQGVTEASMVVVDMPPEEEMAANLTLNNPLIEGTWDESALALVAQVEEADSALFDALNMDGLKETLEKSVPPPQNDGQDGIDVGDDTPPEPNPPDTECPCCSYKWDVRAEDVSIEGMTA